MQSFPQDLWTTCNPNPDGCQPQSGTWTYSRAGWCPGSISAPYNYDLTPLLTSDGFDLSYIFQTNYQDNCHPNNPNCVSGVTCPDCNDGYNPYYRVSSYAISRGMHRSSWVYPPLRLMHRPMHYPSAQTRVMVALRSTWSGTWAHVWSPFTT